MIGGKVNYAPSGLRVPGGRKPNDTQRSPSGTYRVGVDERACRDLADSVLGDLKWLRDADLSGGDEVLLRELSARLRRLLVEGNLQLFRKQVCNCRGEPRIVAPPPLDPVTSDVTHAQVGGAQRAGLTVEGVTVWNRALSAEEIKARYEAGLKIRSQPRQLRLSDWLSETCLQVTGVGASRRDVIKFVANKLGGVHVDPRREPAKSPVYGALDEARESIRVADLDAVYHELASIGQQLVAAHDIRALFN